MTKKYNVIRKHSSDTNTSIVETFGTKVACRKYIKAETEYCKEVIYGGHVDCKVSKLDDVTNLKFSSPHFDAWSIGYWFEKAK